ncbi:MAG TPA: HPr family phosphocarrier protein [Rhizomicrobium sp.]|nr:HPr family phosphocarrier protein [Rhizomicrobium sp.]
MSDPIAIKTIILNKLGLHARAAAKLVEAAARFQSTIEIKKGDETVDARSILGLMMLNARIGSEIEVVATGSDAHEGLAAVLALIQAKFGED